jgi:hypothetical protein
MKISNCKLNEKDEFERKQGTCFVDLLVLGGSNYYTPEALRQEAGTFISTVIE